MARKKMERKLAARLISVAVLAAALLVMLWLGDGEIPGQKPEATTAAGQAATMTAVFIDVGQGDSTLLLMGEEAVLIDAGPDSDAAAVLAALEEYGVDKLDIVVATHAHADHIGGMGTVLQQIPVEELYMPQAVTDTATFDRMMTAVEQRGIDLYAPEPGQRIQLDGAVLTFLYPPQQPLEDEDLNNTSVVLRVDCGSGTLMMTGDAEAEAEAAVLDTGLAVDADVLKVGHHGSDTSSTDRFLSAVSPRIAVISCGADNKYGHPSAQTLGRLQALGTAVYRTDRQGTIVVDFGPGGAAVRGADQAA